MDVSHIHIYTCTYMHALNLDIVHITGNIGCPPVDRIYKRVGLQLNDDSFSGGTLPKKNVHLLSCGSCRD
ncbi:unnamed protein product [Wuchereria bancrofti]|uniref:Uncharacterized protein n=1 Tax=Wuchereria bancrofti TaxID=6293 RepID=A0A3P7ERB1_WUCBA|nr:unnamed protein product [Wuchereria bancrofti]